MTIIDFNALIVGTVLIFAIGVFIGINIEKKATRHTENDLNQKTWERIEGWRK